MIEEGKNILACWLGNEDIKASNDSPTSTPICSVGEPEISRQTGLGPIAQLLQWKHFDKVYLLISYDLSKNSDLYFKWLKTKVNQEIEPIFTGLKNPTDYRSIYNEAVKITDTICEKEKPLESLAFHLSPGTKSMSAVWVLIGKTYVHSKIKKPAIFYQTDLDRSDANNLKPRCGVVDIPFDIEVDFIEPIQKATCEILVPKHVRNDFIAESKEMKLVLDKIARLAPWRDINVLIEGDTGTGKEHVASLIHKNSDRPEKIFIAVNCGSIPKDLVESTLFGHKKGAFTGANKDKPGFFKAATGGTIFLDEIGELRLSDQAALLRVLQEKKIQPVGSTVPEDCDVRVVAATNRSLIDQIAKGKFRADLYFRLATGYIKLPPLKERKKDLKPLVTSLIKEINEEGKKIMYFSEKNKFIEKHISSAAFIELGKHDWPGNIRELQSVLRRVAIFYDGDTISKEAIKNEIQQSVSPYRQKVENDLLPDLNSDGANLKNILKEIKLHYIEKAMELCGNIGNHAGKMLGYTGNTAIMYDIIELKNRGKVFTKKSKRTK